MPVAFGTASTRVTSTVVPIWSSQSSAPSVFVHGCFWHRHMGCRYATMPATRTDFWMKKFAANMQRDKDVRHHLASNGWRVAIVWECALRKSDLVPAAAETVIQWLNSEESLLELGAGSNSRIGTVNFASAVDN